MTQDAVTVFGISLGEHAKGGFAFVDVVATIEDRVARPVANPRDRFPTEGNIYVDKSHWVPARGEGAVWRVRNTKTGPEGQRYAAFSAVSRGQVGPLEIISVPAKASEPDQIRRHLMSGIGLGYTPGSSVLIQTKDGVVIGPVRCDHSDPVGRSGVLVRADALADLLGRWDRVDDLMPFPYDWHGHRRIFTALLDLPESTAFFDCADLGECVRAVMKFASATKTDGLVLTKKQVDALASVLAGDNTPRKIWARASRVIDALRVAVTTAGELDVIRDFLLTNSVVQADLARLREETRLEEQRRITGEESDAKARVADLARKERDTRDHVAELERQLKEASRKAESVIEALIQRMRQRVADTKRDPAEAFANAALLQALLRTSQEVSPWLESDAAGTGDKPSSLTTPSDALTHLETRLRSIGLVQGSARALAREALAAGLAGQVLTFSGSLAPLACDAVAQTLAAGRVSRLSIPVGLLASDGFARCLETSVAVSQEGSTLSALIIQGINRSALEVFAERLTSIIAERQLTSVDRAPNLLVLANAVSGPGALPLPPSLCEMGPIVDTDVLSLGSLSTGKASPCAVPVATWSDWVKTLRAAGDLDVVNEMAGKMGGAPSLLWRRILQCAFVRLCALDVQAPTSLQSLTFGWLLPRAVLSEVDARQMPAELEDGLVDSREADPRIAKLLDRVMARGDRA